MRAVPPGGAVGLRKCGRFREGRGAVLGPAWRGGMGAACEASAVRYTAARLAHARRRRQEARSVAQAHPRGSGTRGRPWAPCGASEASGAFCGLWPVRGRPGALITARDADRDLVSPQSRRPVETYTRVPGHASACDGCRVADTDPPAFSSVTIFRAGQPDASFRTGHSERIRRSGPVSCFRFTSFFHVYR